jgi:hypothetical protein
MNYLQVSLDGGATYVDAPEGVRVIIHEAGEDDDSLLDLHITIDSSCEGIVTDLTAHADPDGTYPLTACYPTDLLVDNCH